MGSPGYSFTIDPKQYQQLYLVQNKSNPLLAQKVYTVTPPITAEMQPVNETLKAFYENSVNVVGTVTPTPTIQFQKQYVTVPQASHSVEDYLMKPVSIQNVALNVTDTINIPISTANSTATVNNINVNKNTNIAIKPKRRKVIKPRDSTPLNHTSVHLIKVGRKYHSLSKLTNEQMKLVQQALQNIGDPVKHPLKPTYDAASNTRIIFKVVSPNDLKVVNNNKIVIDDNPPHAPVENDEKSAIVEKNDQSPIIEKNKKSANIEKQEPEEVTTTRSGRTVKAPKSIEECTNVKKKPKKKLGIPMSCLNCSAEFTSVYNMHRHYEVHPSHIPTANHTSLYHCLLTMVNNGKPEEKTSIFLQELEQLIVKLKSLLPCLLNKFEGIEGTFCTITEDVGRLFGMNPGKYNLNVDALNCEKENDGSCKHNPPKQNEFNSDISSKPSQVWLSKHKEEIATQQESDLCSRTNSIEKWPPFNKRTWKYKQSLINQNANKLKKRHITESEDIHLTDDNISLPVAETTTKSLDKDATISNAVQDTDKLLNITCDLTAENTIPKKSHVQFHSAHFDIRSSPIKSQQCGVFNQFQINLSRIPSKFEGQLLRPFSDAIEETTADNTLEGMLQELNCTKADMGGNALDIIGSLNSKSADTIASTVCYNRPKDWIGSSVDADHSHESFQPNACIEPTMIHIRDGCDSNDQINDHASQMAQVLSVNDSCLTLPPGHLNDCLSFHVNELRTNPMDLPLDLFSFNNP